MIFPSQHIAINSRMFNALRTSGPTGSSGLMSRARSPSLPPPLIRSHRSMTKRRFASLASSLRKRYCNASVSFVNRVCKSAVSRVIRRWRLSIRHIVSSEIAAASIPITSVAIASPLIVWLDPFRICERGRRSFRAPPPSDHKMSLGCEDRCFGLGDYCGDFMSGQCNFRTKCALLTGRIRWRALP